MNTETTGQQAELTADAAVEAVETVIWRHEHGEEVFSGMLKDANEGVAALRELVDAAAYALRTRDESGALSSTAEHNLTEALAACRAVGGAR